MNIRSEILRLRDTCTWSWNGWASAWATEKSLRQWTMVNILSAIMAFSLDLTPGERALILALGLLLLAAELINSALEEITDFISPARHPAAGKIKDIGSAIVAVTAIAGGVAWLMILIG